MAVTMTLMNSTMTFKGNCESRKYLIACDASYPTDGYPIAAAVYPGAVNPFRKIFRSNLDEYIFFDDSGAIYFAQLNQNSRVDGSDPDCYLKIYEFNTGGCDLAEVSNGDDLSGVSFYGVIVGCLAGMCAGDPGLQV